MDEKQHRGEIIVHFHNRQRRVSNPGSQAPQAILFTMLPYSLSLKMQIHGPLHGPEVYILNKIPRWFFYALVWKPLQ